MSQMLSDDRANGMFPCKYRNNMQKIKDLTER